MPRAEQPRRLEELREKLGHTIFPLDISNLKFGFNCVMYALQVENNADLFQLLHHLTYGPQKHLEITMDTGFIRWLIDLKFINEIDTVNAELAVYSVNGKVKHVGRLLSNGRVQSKWGTGHLFEHELLDVPLTYGDTVQFFTGTDVDTVLDEFWSYAESKGAIFNCL
jgi:hypothetical protein